MRIQFFAAVLAVLSAPSAGFSGSCGYANCWGAVAAGPGTIFGYAYGHPSPEAAARIAQQGCKGRCDKLETFANACAAIAVADNGAWGWAYEKNRDLAESSAMNYCMDYGSNCQVRVWTCSQ